MSAWDLAESAFTAAFLSMWLGFAICLISLLFYIGSQGLFSTLDYQKRNDAFGEGFNETGTFLRTSRVGKVANVLLVIGTIALIVAGALAIYALATQPADL